MHCWVTRWEAVIAAIYLDAGFSVAKTVILALWGQRIHHVDTDARDAKTILQEWAQARGLPPPDYDVLSRRELITPLFLKSELC